MALDRAAGCVAHGLIADHLLRDLVDELATAHEDTVRMVVDGADREGWDAHVDYLRALQRLSYEALAVVGCGGPPG
jgi:hypothetical protein